MLGSVHVGSSGSCVLTYEEPEQWLHATWSGAIASYEALQGGGDYLDGVALRPSPYLLNNNLDMHCPWFNAIDWLEHTWLPQAQRLGLRYIAHVVQASRAADVLPLTRSVHMDGLLELQLFHDLAEAKHWLRSCQQRAGVLLQAAHCASS